MTDQKRKKAEAAEELLADICTQERNINLKTLKEVIWFFYLFWTDMKSEVLWGNL